MKKKNIIVLSVLAIIIAFMDISGLPGGLIKCVVADVEPFVIPFLFNFIFIGIVAFIVVKAFKVDYTFGFSFQGTVAGLKRYALPGILAGICSLAAFYFGLRPFDYHPTVWKVLFEGLLYYIGVGMVEEFYVRGLFLNVVESLFSKKLHKTEIAIVVSSVVFGLGHIPGMIGMGAGVIAFKIISTIGMGLYLGMIYKRTNNLWVPILMHITIDWCALPYCFTTIRTYPDISIIILVITYLMLGGYSCMKMKNPN